jgi:hypothetical protein
MPRLLGVVALAAHGTGRDTARAMSDENVELSRRWDEAVNGRALWVIHI